MFGKDKNTLQKQLTRFYRLNVICANR